MKKDASYPVTFEQFEAIYFANLQAPDRPSAETAYRRAEAAVFVQTGERRFASYNSFKVMLSKRRSKPAARFDKKEQLTAVIQVVNTYICSIDLPFLKTYFQEIYDKRTQMEIFGPMNGSYNAAELQTLKDQETALQHLIKYIETAIK